MPITGPELEKRLEALQRRNMGSRQHRREAARSSGNREAAAGAPPDPAVEMPFYDQPSTTGQASAASELPPYLLDLMDEDW